MSSDSDIKTRVTPLEELKLQAKQGQDCLVVIYSSDPRKFGKRQVLADEPVLLGRGAENTIVLENDSVSRTHAAIEKHGSYYYVKDLGSTNGTYVNDDQISNYALRRGDQVKVGDTIFKFLSGSDIEAQYHETIYRMTIMDGLTGVHNKRYLLETLEREISRARRHRRPLSLVMLDIDHFKTINDNFGHLAGDYVLKELASVIKSRLRPDDLLARYGGEEFGIVLPETGRAGGHAISENLRRLIEERIFVFEGGPIQVTVSAGVAELDETADVEAFIGSADALLYQAKRQGRNRICA